MSPRKSSTSSGNRFERPRYLLVEVSGAGTPSPRSIEEALVRRLPTAPVGAPFRFRIILSDGLHALVAVEHRDAPAARSAWNAPGGPGVPGLRTIRSYGTIRKARGWLAARRVPARRTADPVTGQRPRRR